MLTELKSYFNKGFNFYGIEIFDNQNALCFQVSQIQQKKKELLILNEDCYSSWEDLMANLDIKIPVCLSYNTKSVIDKIVKKETQTPDKNLIEGLFPNLDFSRFYFNITLFDDQYYIAIAEKEPIAEFLQKFKQAKISITNLNLGLAALAYTKPFIKDDHIKTNSKQIDFSSELNSDTEIKKIKFSKENSMPLSINGLSFKSSSLLTFSSVIRYLTPNKKITTNYLELSKELSDNSKYTRRFQALLWPIIGLFLVLLLVNFFVFNSYFQKLEVLNQDSNLSISNTEKLKALKEDVLNKEIRVDAILNSKNSKSTYFLDKISNTIPKSVLLDNITYQPLLKPMRDLKPLEQDLNIILIKGETSNSDDFAYWIDTIEKFNWVTSVKILDYSFKAKNSSYFTLKLSIDAE